MEKKNVSPIVWVVLANLLSVVINVLIRYVNHRPFSKYVFWMALTPVLSLIKYLGIGMLALFYVKSLNEVNTKTYWNVFLYLFLTFIIITFLVYVFNVQIITDIYTYAIWFLTFAGDVYLIFMGITIAKYIKFKRK